MSAASEIQLTDILMLQSFLVALAQLDTELPPELYQTIHQMGEQLKLNAKRAIAQIPNIVQQHDRLCTLYNTAYNDLERRLQTREQLRITALATGDPQIATTWKRSVASTLTAGNPVRAARSMIRQVATRRSGTRASDAMTPLLLPLLRTARCIDAQELAILQALEYRPLTVEDLTYRVGLSMEQVQTILGSLWEAGYVDVTSGPLFYRIFPWLQSSNRSAASVDPEAAFTLTMRGHFRLHPLLSGRQFGGALP